VHKSLGTVLRLLEHHYVLIAICIAVLLVLASVFLIIRKGGVFRRRRRRHHPRPSIPTGPAPTGEDAQALLREWEWASDKAPPSFPVEPGRQTTSVGPAPPPASAVPLRLVQKSAASRAASSTPGQDAPLEPTELDQLLKLADLFERKLLTRQEFEEGKRLLLERDSSHAAPSSTASRKSKIDPGSFKGEPGQE